MTNLSYNILDQSCLSSLITIIQSLIYWYHSSVLTYLLPYQLTLSSINFNHHSLAPLITLATAGARLPQDQFRFTNHTVMGDIHEEFIANGAPYNTVDGHKQTLECVALQNWMTVWPLWGVP